MSSRSRQASFVLLDNEEKLQYPLFGVLPYPFDLRAQAAIAAAIVVVLLSAVYLLHDSDTDETLSERVSLWLSVLWNEIMATAVSSLGLGSDVISRMQRLTGKRAHGTSFGPSSQANLASRATKRNRNAASLRRAAPSAAGSTMNGSAGQAASSEITHLPGLHNTGNTCFFNSVLQSLASLEGVTSYLDGIVSLAERWDVATPVTDALRDLVAVLNTPGRKPSAVYPSELSRALGQVSLLNGTRSLVGAHQQQDAHELLVLLTSAIDDELSVVKAHRAEMLRLSRSGLRAALPLSYLEEPVGKEDPVNIFRGLMAQRTSCYTCGYTEAIRHHAFDELNLNVPNYACTLEHCLAKWEEVEEVEWVCHACSLRRTLARLSADCARLEGSAGSILQEVNASGAQHFDGKTHGKMNGHAKTNGNATKALAGEKMSASKKKRLKEARKLEARVRTVLELGLHEDEAHDSDLLEGIKLDRTPSPSSTKHVMLARSPQVLAIHLNRSNYYSAYGASKNNAAVRFGELLDLRPFVTTGSLSVTPDEPISSASPIDGLKFGGSPAQAQINTTPEERLQYLYRLKSVVVHLGGHHFGHYIAFRRRPTPASSSMKGEVDELGLPAHLSKSSWLYISDERVSPCSIDEVLRQSAYLLFYEKVHSGPQSGGATPQTLNGHPHQEASGAAIIGMENLTRAKHLRMKALTQPQVVPRWSVEPPSRETTPAPAPPATASLASM